MAKAIGLTDSELKAVKSTWTIVMSTNIAETAAGLLLTFAVAHSPLLSVISLYIHKATRPVNRRWWEKDPNILRVFPRFRGKTIAELKTMPRVRSHGSHVFTAIDAIVRNLEDEDISGQLLLDCKRDHLKFRDLVSVEEYKVCSS